MKSGPERHNVQQHDAGFGFEELNSTGEFEIACP